MERLPVPAAMARGLRLPCWLCGDAMHMVADTRLDAFTWVDDGGSKTATDTDLRQLEEHGGAYARLKWLADEMGRLLKTQKTRKGERVWPDDQTQAEYFARGREYSALKARLEGGGTFHCRVVLSSGRPDYQGELLYCCGWPARLRPSGWQCRQCGQPVAA